MARVVFGGPVAGGRGVGGLPGEADVAGVHVEVVDQVPAPEDVGDGVIRRSQPFLSRPTVRLIHIRGRRWVVFVSLASTHPVAPLPPGICHLTTSVRRRPPDNFEIGG